MDNQQIQIDLETIKKCYEDWEFNLDHYSHINRYYYGNTDSLRNFRPKMGRSNLKINTNFVAKLVDEEAQYSFDNDITLTSKDGNSNAIKDIEYVLLNNKADHNINLGRELICFGQAFEISYINKSDGRFLNRKVNPLNGYMYLDENDEAKYFLHIYNKQLDNKPYIDVYTDTEIYHFDSKFSLLGQDSHYFGVVPVGFGVVGGKSYSYNRGYVEGDKTIFRTIKSLQDALETNLGDITSEISDFRNAILKMYGIELEDAKDTDGNIILGSDGLPLKQTPVMRDNAILYFGDKSKEDAVWLTKDINDTFVKNTRDDLKDLIYTLTSHIDSNEKMQSNLSGIALRSKLQTLESKCRDNEKAMTNIIRTRLKCVCKYLFLTKSKAYDPNMIGISYTPSVPVDEQSLADIISKVPHEVVSNYTKRSWLPRITNPDIEQEIIDKENESQIPDMGLDNLDKTNANNAMDKNMKKTSNCC